MELKQKTTEIFECGILHIWEVTKKLNKDIDNSPNAAYYITVLYDTVMREELMHE